MIYIVGIYLFIGCIFTAMVLHCLLKLQKMDQTEVKKSIQELGDNFPGTYEQVTRLFKHISARTMMMTILFWPVHVYYSVQRYKRVINEKNKKV